MTLPRETVIKLLLVGLVIGIAAVSAHAQDVQRETTVMYEEEGVVVHDEFRFPEDLWIPPNGEMPKTKAIPAEFQQAEGKAYPVSFILDYTLATDHMFRGLNLTEYAGEGREDLVHQVGLALEHDTEALGVFGVAFWVYWWGGSDDAGLGDSGNCQEVDYTAYWRLPYTYWGLSAEVGWSALQDPSDVCTQEIYVRLNWNDAPLWQSMGCDTESAFLNPYVFYAIDYDQAEWGSWLEFGLQPIWSMGDLPYVGEVPVMRAMYLQPKVAVGVDHRYWGGIIDGVEQSTQLFNIVYGVEVGYDFGEALDLPEEYGSFIVAGFLHYNQAFEDFADDNLWGGVRVAWAW